MQISSQLKNEEEDEEALILNYKRARSSVDYRKLIEILFANQKSDEQEKDGEYMPPKPRKEKKKIRKLRKRSQINYRLLNEGRILNAQKKSVYQ